MIQNIWWPQKYYFFKIQQLIKKKITQTMSIKMMFLLLIAKKMKADSLIKFEG